MSLHLSAPPKPPVVIAPTAIRPQSDPSRIWRRWAAVLALTTVVSATVAAISGLRVAPQTGLATRAPEPVKPSVRGAAGGPRAGATEMATRQFLARVASGDLQGSRELLAPPVGAVNPAAPFADGDWLANLAALRPQVLRTTELPGPAPGRVPAEPARGAVIAWVQYQALGVGSGTGRGALFVDLEFAPGPPGAWRVRSVTGPVVPPGGYARLPLALFSARGVPLTGGIHPAVLWTPRRPEAPLVAAMQRLWKEQQGRLQAALVLDVSSPADWDRFARASGWQGPIYRAKQRLDQVPVPQVQPYYGAVGLLIDRTGTVVASLGALDPSRYGLLPDAAGQVESQVAAQVLTAYGLTR